MLKFVKRINEDHQRSKSLNPPILGKELIIFYVKIAMIYRFFFRENTTDFKKLIFIYLFSAHCSAGVGRSGTLVAIDGLVQQLREENHVAIYSMVCDLRHQRNYLVQSVVSFLYF